MAVAQATSTFRFSLLTSCKSAFPSSTSQSCSSNCWKSGPLNHLLFIQSLRCLLLSHWRRSGVLGNATNQRALYCTESHPLGRRKGVCSFNFHPGSMRVQHGCQSIIVLPRRLAITAACNSRRGIISSFKGVTLDLAETNGTPNLPSFRFHFG